MKEQLGDWGVFLMRDKGEKDGDELEDDNIICPVMPTGAPADWVECVMSLMANSGGGRLPVPWVDLETRGHCC